jgi:hypothetical protein
MDAAELCLLDHFDLAEILKMPATRVLRMARSGKIPHLVLPDKTVMFERQVVVEWLKACRQEAQA